MQRRQRLIRHHDPMPFLLILEGLALATPPPLRNAAEIADALAHAARLVREIGRAQCRAGAPPRLADVQAEFRETLFAHAAAGGTKRPMRDGLDPLMRSPRLSLLDCC